MSALKEIEDVVLKLSESELAALLEWFAEFDAAAWDQTEDNIAAGRLDAFANEALDDLRAGR